MAREGLCREVPILGICRGAQTLNVARGGTLHQHLPDVVGDVIAHRQSVDGRVPTHLVTILPGSRLAAALGTTQLSVNSFHHQAVDRLGDWPARVRLVAGRDHRGDRGSGPAIRSGRPVARGNAPRRSRPAGAVRRARERRRRTNPAATRCVERPVSRQRLDTRLTRTRQFPQILRPLCTHGPSTSRARAYGGEHPMGTSVGHPRVSSEAEWAEWNTAVRPYSVGVEEEVMLLDPQKRWALAQRIEDVLEMLPPALVVTSAPRRTRRRSSSGPIRTNRGPGDRAAAPVA